MYVGQQQRRSKLAVAAGACAGGAMRRDTSRGLQSMFFCTLFSNANVFLGYVMCMLDNNSP